MTLRSLQYVPYKSSTFLFRILMHIQHSMGFLSDACFFIRLCRWLPVNGFFLLTLNHWLTPAASLSPPPLPTLLNSSVTNQSLHSLIPHFHPLILQLIIHLKKHTLKTLSHYKLFYVLYVCQILLNKSSTFTSGWHLWKGPHVSLCEASWSLTLCLIVFRGASLTGSLSL